MDSLNDVQNRARLLITFAPESSRNVVRALDGLKVYRRHADMNQLVEDERHALRCWQANCNEASGLMNELAIVCRKLLPELRLKWVRVNPPWRYDDPALDWEPIIDELRLIEDEAITKIQRQGESDHYVTLKQAAAMVSKSKETLEPLIGNELPEPDIRAAKGSGKAHEWKWSTIRPSLEKRFGRKLPERYPADIAGVGKAR